MRDHLSSLFLATAPQARAHQPAGRAVGRERAAQVSARHDAPWAEFSLPAEPQERRGLERSRRRADETPARSETCGAGGTRETAPRRQDPPRRADQPQRGEARRPERCDEPCRGDAPDPSRAEEVTTEAPSPQQAEAGDDTMPAETDARAETETGEQPERGEAAVAPATTPAVAAALPEVAALAGAPAAPAETTLPQTSVPEAALVEPAQPDAGPVDATLPVVATLEAAPQTVLPETGAVEAPTAESALDDVALPATAVSEAALPASAPSETSLPQGATDQGQPSSTQAEPAPGAADGPAVVLDQAMPASVDEALSEAQLETALATGFETTATSGAAPVQPLQEPASAQRAAPAESGVQTLDAARRPDLPAGALPPHGAEHGVKSETPGTAALPRADAVRSENSVSARAAGPDQFAQTGSQAGPQSTPSITPNFASHLPAGTADPSVAATQSQRSEAPVQVVSEVPLGAVPIEIGLKSLAGINRFEIRLDPAELGRIEVSLEIDDKGEVKAHLTVDKVETLALLQRDARTLERAFEQAGLKSSDGGVNLSLRDQQHQGQQGQSGDGRDGSRAPRSEPGREHRDAAPPPPRRFWRGTTGVDVRV